MAKWDFTLDNGDRLFVRPGSGHWSQVINIETVKLGKSVYVYEAMLVHVDGTTQEGPVMQSALRWLRRQAKKAAVQSAVEQAGSHA